MQIASNPSVTLESPIVQSTLAHLDLIHDWVLIHVNILERWESKKYFGFKLMGQNANFAQTFAKILSITVPIGKAAGTFNQFISHTGFHKLDDLLNKVKYRTLEVLNQIFKYLFEKVPNSEKIKSPFLQKGIQFSPYLTNSLISFASRGDITDLLAEESIQEIVVESIETLVLFSAEKEF